MAQHIHALLALGFRVLEVFLMTIYKVDTQLRLIWQWACAWTPRLPYQLDLFCQILPQFQHVSLSY